MKLFFALLILFQSHAAIEVSRRAVLLGAGATTLLRIAPISIKEDNPIIGVTHRFRLEEMPMYEQGYMIDGHHPYLQYSADSLIQANANLDRLIVEPRSALIEWKPVDFYESSAPSLEQRGLAQILSRSRFGRLLQLIRRESLTQRAEILAAIEKIEPSTALDCEANLESKIVLIEGER